MAQKDYDYDSISLTVLSTVDIKYRVKDLSNKFQHFVGFNTLEWTPRDNASQGHLSSEGKWYG